MIYRNLSLAAGGGIISQREQADQEECANIFIGLGGTGISCLREIKAQVYSRLKKDDEKSEIPTYKHIQFLAIDTDENSLGDDGTLNTLESATEFRNIGTASIKSLIGNPDLLRQNNALRWFTDNISIENASAGAGGVRQIGRLLLIQNVDEIVGKVISKINTAREGLNDKSIFIHIFTGMGGGTGSGTFLDFCYILKHILKELSLDGQAQTSGYFFLPDVNLARVSADTVRKYIEINGFAAMKELDYCMNFHNNHGEWNQDYGSFKVRSTEQPVELAYLITAKDENGNIKPNGYNYAMNVVAEYVMEFMTKQIVSEKERKSGDFGLKSHISNFRNTVKMVDKRRGVCHDYCVLGAANAFVPFKDINSYLAGRIFERFSDLPRSNSEITSILESLSYSYDDIFEEAGKTEHTIPLFEIDPVLLKDQCGGITINPNSIEIPNVLKHLRDALESIKGDHARNCSAITERMIPTILEKLYQFSADCTKGPYYAAYMLCSNQDTKERDLRDVLKGYIEQNAAALRNARGDRQLRKAAVDAALQVVQAKRAKSKHANNYVAAVHSYIKNEDKIDLLEKMDAMFSAILPQVKDAYDDNFAPLLEMLETVDQTFKANLLSLRDAGSENTDYAVKIIDLQDDRLVELLDTCVNEINCDKIIEGFIAHMLKPENKKIWRDRSNEVKLSNIISSYFADALSSIANRNIDQYLATKFEIDTPNALANAVYSRIIIDLNKNAKPLFWARQGQDTITTSQSKIGYISVPDTSDIISNAARQLNESDDKISVRSSVMPDRISILTFYCGIPMYMFQGTYTYKPKYKNKPLTGMHLYEGTALDPRDFRKLNDIDPFNIVKFTEPTDAIRKFDEDYNTAFSRRIIDKVATDTEAKSFEYFLRIVDKAKINALVQTIEKTLKEGNSERQQKLYEAIDKDKFEYSDSILLPVIGTYGDFIEWSVQDAVFASDYLRDKMYEQLEALAPKYESLNKLEEAIGGELSWRKDVDDFTDAICTGVIFRDVSDSKYTFKYQKEEGGIFAESYTLTNIDTEPYGKRIPIISAFVQYRKLDEDDKSAIASLAKDRILHDEDKCERAANEIKKYLEERVGVIGDTAGTDFPGDKGFILKTVELLARKIANFIRNLMV